MDDAGSADSVFTDSAIARRCINPMPDHDNGTPDDPVETASEPAVRTVRLREGVYATGAAVSDNIGEPTRVIHLASPDADLGHPDGVEVCCGVRFAPDTLEEVPWGELWPHARCVRRSPWRRPEIESSFQAAEKTLAQEKYAEIEPSFLSLKQL